MGKIKGLATVDRLVVWLEFGGPIQSKTISMNNNIPPSFFFLSFLKLFHVLP